MCVNPRLLISSSPGVEELHPAGMQNIKAYNASNKLSWKEMKLSEEFLLTVVFCSLAKQHFSEDTVL